jgi:ABC-type antimicrobial peptide transport system permease subunit
VLAYTVVQRTQEIGVRMALGADRRRVIGLVLGRGLLMTIVGVTLGLGAAAAGARSLQSLLFGIEPLDLRTFVAVGFTFALVASLASYLPARRATKVDPLVALRVD